MRQILLQNATVILLQDATKVYYKMRQVFYYKMRQFYYRMRQLLQNTTILLQNAGIITKCDVYYKFRQYDVLKIDVRPVRMKFRVQLMKSKVQLKSATNEI